MYIVRLVLVLVLPLIVFKPITKRRDSNHVITFDSQLKTTLLLTNTITDPYVLREPVSRDGSFRFQLRG